MTLTDAQVEAILAVEDNATPVIAIQRPGELEPTPISLHALAQAVKDKSLALAAEQARTKALREAGQRVSDAYKYEAWTELSASATLGLAVIALRELLASPSSQDALKIQEAQQRHTILTAAMLAWNRGYDRWNENWPMDADKLKAALDAAALDDCAAIVASVLKEVGK